VALFTTDMEVSDIEVSFRLSCCLYVVG